MISINEIKQNDSAQTPQFTKSAANVKMSPSDKENINSFYNSFKHVLILSQIFGLLPVHGILGSNHSNIKFKWWGWKTVFTLVILLLYIVTALPVSIVAFRDGLNFQNIGPFVFILNAIATNIILLMIGRKWFEICEKWWAVEQHMIDYGYVHNLSRKMKIHTLVFTLLSIGEHALSKAKSILKLILCPLFEVTLGNIVEEFIHVRGAEIYEFIPYHPIIGFLQLVAMSSATFAWSFPNLLIALISLQLSSRFKQINTRLKEVKGQNLPTSFWKKVRRDYNSLSVLTKDMDGYFQKLTALALGINLWYICLQLLNGLETKQNTYKIVYFFYSLGFLIYRTCLLSLLAADINDESKQSQYVLHSVPSSSYCTDVKRFQEQIAWDVIALTGCRFFYVTRSLLLTITGSIITYEIVLVQFSDKKGQHNRNETWCD